MNESREGDEHHCCGRCQPTETDNKPAWPQAVMHAERARHLADAFAPTLVAELLLLYGLADALEEMAE